MKKLHRYLEQKKKTNLAGLELRVLSSYELLSARAAAGDAEDAGLRFNCAVLAKALEYRGRAVFSSAEQVMQHLSVEQVQALAEQYCDLCHEQDLLGASLYEISRVMRPIDRLRWRVLREFGVLPSSAQAQRMTDGDVLFCAAAMGTEHQDVNTNFDWERFEALQ